MLIWSVFAISFKVKGKNYATQATFDVKVSAITTCDVYLYFHVMLMQRQWVRRIDVRGVYVRSIRTLLTCIFLSLAIFEKYDAVVYSTSLVQHYGQDSIKLCFLIDGWWRWRISLGSLFPLFLEDWIANFRCGCFSSEIVSFDCFTFKRLDQNQIFSESGKFGVLPRRAESINANTLPHNIWWHCLEDITHVLAFNSTDHP